MSSCCSTRRIPTAACDGPQTQPASQPGIQPTTSQPTFRILSSSPKSPHHSLKSTSKPTYRVFKPTSKTR